MRTITLDLPANLLEVLFKYAKITHQPFTEEVATILRAGLSLEGKRMRQDMANVIARFLMTAGLDGTIAHELAANAVFALISPPDHVQELFATVIVKLDAIDKRLRALEDAQSAVPKRREG